MLGSAHITVTLKSSAPHESNSLEKAIDTYKNMVMVVFMKSQSKL